MEVGRECEVRGASSSNPNNALSSISLSLSLSRASPWEPDDVLLRSPIWGTSILLLQQLAPRDAFVLPEFPQYPNCVQKEGGRLKARIH